MEKAKVYFTDFRVHRHSMLVKLSNLMKKAGIEDINFEKQFTAIKIHFGEPGNLAYIRPNYAKTVVDSVRALGGIPFLTDSNTLYTGRRANTVDHLGAAYENGFNPLTVGCHIVIADGLKGGNYVDLPVPNAVHCPTAKIGSDIANADIVISMNHFKGHEQAGFGGALKNLGMGSASRAGKLEQHSTSKPLMIKEKCVACGACIKNCSQNAIFFDENKKATIDDALCVGCGQCIVMCKFDAAQADWNASADILCEKIAEYAYATINDKPSFHINFIMDVSPNCDCWSLNDVPIVPNIGIAAGFDPVALDKACMDMVNKAAASRGSELTDKKYQEGNDKIHHLHPNTHWEQVLIHAEKIGLGTQKYEVIRV